MEELFDRHRPYAHDCPFDRLRIGLGECVERKEYPSLGELQPIEEGASDGSSQQVIDPGNHLAQ